MLVIVETHPIQYHAPVWAAAAARGVPLHVVYGADFSVKGHQDPEFQAAVQWNSSLLEGYSSEVLPSGPHGQAADYDGVTSHGLVAALNNLRPTALLSSGYTHRLDRRTVIESWRRRLPLLYRAEANDSALQRTVLKAWSRDLVLRNLYSTMAAVLSIGQEATAHYRRLGVPAKKIFQSPYAVDTTPFQPSENDRQMLRQRTREQLGIEPHSPVVLFSGKLSHRKGVDLLLAAIADIPDHERPVLVLLGDGALRSHLEQSTLPVHRILLGFKPQQQLSPWFHAADLLALPSRHSETWGLVVNEALHHGLPAVVSDAVGSRHDLIHPGFTGEICQRDNPVSLTAALRRCLGYAGTAASRQRCRQTVAGYSIDAAAKGLEQAWEFCRQP